MPDLKKVQSKLDESIAFFYEELKKLRTGRASPSLIDHLSVEVYGSKTNLLSLASIHVPDARTIVVQPWDKNTIKDIESAIRASELNVSPVAEGNVIRIILPQLTEENRSKLVKILLRHAESCRVSMRQIREKTRSEISRELADGIVSEDQKFKLQKELDELLKRYTDRIEELSSEKEREIMTI